MREKEFFESYPNIREQQYFDDIDFALDYYDYKEGLPISHESDAAKFFNLNYDNDELPVNSDISKRDRHCDGDDLDLDNLLFND